MYGFCSSLTLSLPLPAPAASLPSYCSSQIAPLRIPPPPFPPAPTRARSPAHTADRSCSELRATPPPPPRRILSDKPRTASRNGRLSLEALSPPRPILSRALPATPAVSPTPEACP